MSVSITWLFINKNFAFGNVFVLTHLKALEIDSSPELKARLSHSASIQKGTFPVSKCGSCNSPDSRCHQPTDWLKSQRERELNHLAAASFPLPVLRAEVVDWGNVRRKLRLKHAVKRTRRHVRRAAERHFFAGRGGGVRVALHQRTWRGSRDFWLTFRKSDSPKHCCVMCKLLWQPAFMAKLTCIFIQNLFFFFFQFSHEILVTNPHQSKGLFKMAKRVYNENTFTPYASYGYMPWSGGNLGKNVSCYILLSKRRRLSVSRETCFLHLWRARVTTQSVH